MILAGHSPCSPSQYTGPAPGPLLCSAKLLSYVFLSFPHLIHCAAAPPPATAQVSTWYDSRKTRNKHENITVDCRDLRIRQQWKLRGKESAVYKQQVHQGPHVASFLDLRAGPGRAGRGNLTTGGQCVHPDIPDSIHSAAHYATSFMQQRLYQQEPT